MDYFSLASKPDNFQASLELMAQFMPGFSFSAFSPPFGIFLEDKKLVDNHLYAHILFKYLTF